MSTLDTTTDCEHCGAAPVNHVAEYVESSLSLLPSLLFPFAVLASPRFLDINRSPVVRSVGRVFVVLAELLGVIRYSDDINGAVSDRTKSVWEEALRRGIRMEQLVVCGLKREEMRALLPSRKGGGKLSWEYFESLPIPPWLRQGAPSWIDDKSAFKNVFRKNGLRVADGASALTLAHAKAIFRRLGTSCITKPRDGSRARHTTVNIQSEEQLEEGFRRAQQLSPCVMVEEFVTGRLYRATCVNKKLIGVIEFVRPVIEADGKSTAEELRVLHNAHKRFPHLTDVKADAWFYDAIKHQGYAPESIPPKGMLLLLSEHSERPNGGYFIDITDSIPESTVLDIERAAQVCDVEVIGFDIISHDLTYQAETFVYIEGNTLPYIELHDVPYEGLPRSVSGALWDLWFEESPSAKASTRARDQA